MKQILRILLAVGVIAFAASMLAVSCGKTADPNNNNNNSGNNSSGDGGGGNGGDGNGGGTPTPTPPPTGTITIGNFDATAAKLGTQVGGNDRVIINASQFPTAGRALSFSETEVDLFSVDPPNVARVFDLTITGGGVTGAATGGMMIVDIGSRAKFADIAMTTAPTTGNAGAGVVYNTILTRPTPLPSILGVGLNIFGIFIDNATPTSNDPNATPFAFSTTGGLAPHPIFFCVSSISPITSTTPAATVALTGGQTANCYVGGQPDPFTGTHVSNWFTGLTNNANLKKRFYFTVAAMRTDSKALSEVVKSLTGATDAAKVGAFMDGLTTAEMETIRKDNITAFKKIMVEVVTDAVFTAP